MSNPEEDKRHSAHGDVIHASVGENAQNVAIGKRIVQIIIGKLNLPPWLLYVITGSFVVGIAILTWLVIRLTLGVPVIIQPQPTFPSAPLAIQPSCPAPQHCLLIADFAPTGDDLANEITRKVRASFDNSDQNTARHFTVMPTTIISSTQAAQQVVEQEGALVLVWGQLFRNFGELEINIALTDQLGVDESRAIRPYRIHYFDSLTQQITCTGSCFTDLNRVRTLIGQLSTVIAYTAAGMMYYANDQPEAATVAFTQALACAGEPPPTTPPLTTTQPVSTGFASQAVNSFTAADCPIQQAARQPIDGLNAAALYYYAGKAHILTGDYRTAIELLQMASDRNPQDPAAQIAIATAYQSWLDQDDAPPALAALTQAESRTIILHNSLVTQKAAPAALAAIAYELGFIAELRQDWQAAIEHYGAAVEIFGEDNQESYISLIGLGRVQRLAGDKEAAEANLQTATILDAAVPWAWLELAKLNRNEQPQAQAQLTHARQVAPNQAYVDIVEGDLCAAWQDFTCAQGAYARALAKRPQSGWLYDKVGEFYQPDEPSLPHQGWAKAVDYYQEAVKWRTNNPWTQERLAFALLQIGEYTAAAEHYALSLAQSHPDTLAAGRFCMLGQAQKEALMFEEAKTNLQICLDGLNDSEQRALVEGWIAEIEADKQYRSTSP